MASKFSVLERASLVVLARHLQNYPGAPDCEGRRHWRHGLVEILARL
jgi:hypothetical protein